MNRWDRVKTNENYIKTFVPRNKTRTGTVLSSRLNEWRASVSDNIRIDEIIIVKWDDTEEEEELGVWWVDLVEKFQYKQNFFTEIG